MYNINTVNLKAHSRNKLKWGRVGERNEIPGLSSLFEIRPQGSIKQYTVNIKTDTE